MFKFIKSSIAVAASAVLISGFTEAEALNSFSDGLMNGWSRVGPTRPVIETVDSAPLTDNMQVTSSLAPQEPVIPETWLQVPPVLVNPLIVANYDDYGTGTERTIDARGGDLLLLAHAPNGVPEVLKECAAKCSKLPTFAR